MQSNVHGRASLVVMQSHGGYNFGPGLWLAADAIYYSGDETSVNRALVEEKQIAPHIPVIDKSKRTGGTFSRDDFRYGGNSDAYVCPAGMPLTIISKTGTLDF